MEAQPSSSEHKMKMGKMEVHRALPMLKSIEGQKETPEKFSILYINIL